MDLIVDTDALSAFCGRVGQSNYITVDTEFIRDKTYWSRLCLVQVAGAGEAVAIDALSETIDLAPLFALMNDAGVLKVFHAARQDVEIFYHLDGRVPAPLFDTQVAAMVCGFGESAGYDRLVSKLARATIDKSQRFTDWSRRPLSKKLIDYAISDVTHLRVVYDKLSAQLAENRRAEWLSEEMATLTDPATYRQTPEDGWKRVKNRLRKPRHIAIFRKLAAWREAEAQRRDVPRNRILRDETLSEIAAQEPQSPEDLSRLRALGRGRISQQTAQAIIDVVAEVRAALPSTYPDPRPFPPPVDHIGPTADLLKVLLKMRCEENRVAQKLIATVDDIEAIAASDEADVAALRGWRREIFGKDALALKHGRIALTVDDGDLRIVRRER